MILELCGETEVEGHVSGQDGADDQLADLMHTTRTAIAVKTATQPGIMLSMALLAVVNKPLGQLST